MVRVRYLADLLCPAPPRFERGHVVIAFLCEDELPDDHVVAVLDLDEDARTVYLARIEEWCALERERLDDDERRAAEREWLLRCVEDPRTRWEGAYDLRPLEQRLATDDPADRVDYRASLRPEHWEHLVQVLDDAGRNWDAGTLELARILTDHSEAVDRDATRSQRSRLGLTQDPGEEKRQLLRKFLRLVDQRPKAPAPDEPPGTNCAPASAHCPT